jgi:hypothetical protein
MKKFGIGIVSCFAIALATSPSSFAQSTIADWTFETSQPITAGPVSPEIGSGSATGSHVGATTYSSPAGNGSAHSYSATAWAVGDYWQFQVSTVNYQDLVVSYDQTSSNTGPGRGNFSYSTDGINFTVFSSNYTILANAAPNPVWNSSTSSSLYTYTYDLSAIASLENVSAVYFRVVDASTTSANGGAVGSGGTDRVDNFTVTATPVPEPGSLTFLASGGLLLCGHFARRRK